MTLSIDQDTDQLTSACQLLNARVDIECLQQGTLPSRTDWIISNVKKCYGFASPQTACQICCAYLTYAVTIQI
jgi:hypothetical protein